MLLWYVDTFKRTNRAGYPWHVEGRFVENEFPNWVPPNDGRFSWSIPNFNHSAYVFTLHVVDDATR